jgi:hypothetical protein
VTQDFGRCVGVELLASLHEAASTVLHKYNAQYKDYLHTTQPQHVQVR